MSGDPNWQQAWRELDFLHRQKSRTYGAPGDPLANFTVMARWKAQEPEEYVIDRTVEKLTRALHMIRAGNPAGVQEYKDCASLMLCAEALRRRRGGD